MQSAQKMSWVRAESTDTYSEGISTEPNRITFNDFVAFLVEVAALVALGVWGYRSGSSTAGSWLLGLGIPAVAILLWALFAAPRSVYDVFLAELAVKVLVLGGGVLAAFTLVPTGWAIAFALLVVVSTMLLYVGPLAR